MIGITLNGRYGNQLFQLAFAISLAKKRNTKFFVLTDNDNPLLVDLNSPYHVKKSFYRFKLDRLLNKILPKKFINHGIGYDLNREHCSSNHTIYSGFFQSEKYFDSHLSKEDLRFQFNIPTPTKSSRISMHVRAEDYEFYGDDSIGGSNMILPISFYQNALTELQNFNHFQTLKEEMEIVSGDKNYVNEHFRFSNFHFEERSAKDDFIFLMQSSHLVLSNSSFAWWAAYLSSAEVVMAPQNWLGFKIESCYPPDIICKNWKVIPCKMA